MARAGLVITVIVLVGYYIFTSGLVYELTGNTNISNLEIPYSFGFSADRIGLAAAMNDDDVACMKWLFENWKDGDLVVADYNIVRIIGEYDYRIFFKYESGYYLIPEFRNMPDRCYIFISSWNTRHNGYVIGTSIGLRKIEKLPDLPYEVAFKSGDAMILRKGF